jgi:hypothetical protein
MAISPGEPAGVASGSYMRSYIVGSDHWWRVQSGGQHLGYVYWPLALMKVMNIEHSLNLAGTVIWRETRTAG